MMSDGPVTVPSVGVGAPVGASPLARRLQRAMQQAILDAQAEGIDTSEANSDILRTRMNAARDEVLAQLYAQDEERLPK